MAQTYTGQYEDVKTINDLLLEKNKAEGLDVHIVRLSPHTNT